MLSAAHRLRSRTHIQALHARGAVVRGRRLLLRYQRRQTGQARFAFSISQKVSKRATDRNRLRRQLREIVRAHPAALRYHGDVVISARPSAHGTSFAELTTELTTLLKRAHILSA